MCRDSDSYLLLSTSLKEVSSLKHNMVDYLLNINTGQMAFNGLTNIHGCIMGMRAGGGAEMYREF